MQKIPGGNIMKTLPLAIVSAAIVLASCSSSKQAAYSEYDDVYYNPNLAERQVASAPSYIAVTPQEAMSTQPISQEPVYVQSQVYADEALSDYEQYKLQREAEMLGETYQPDGSEALYATQYQEYDSTGLVSEYGQENAPVIINNYYTDPNDYYYSSNLRRFSDSYNGWDYYDPYYTNPYFYSGRSMGWGMNIGYGYGGWGLGFSFGYPYYGSYYPSYYGYGGGYYDPYYSHYGYGGYYGGYYPYYGGSYWSGYNHGYYNGYWDSNYYGSRNSYRYGRLDNRHYYGYSSPSNTTYGSSKGSTYVDPRYRSRSGSTGSSTGVTRESTSDRTTKSAGVTRTNDQRTDRGNHYGNDRSDNNTRDMGNVNRNRNPGNRSTPPGQVKRNTYSNLKTTRTSQPANVQQRSANSNNRGTYTPSYSKPRTSSTPSYNRSSTPTRSYSQPSSTPSRSSSSYSRQSSTPSRSSSSYTRPSSSSRSSSSYSRPSSSSRSSSSYSRPSSSSRSSSSYSSPSRSSSSSSRSSSGSSSRSSSGSSSRSSSRR